jgi:hypothetical protein
MYLGSFENLRAMLDTPSKAKRDRAAYMRDYRAKAGLLGSTALAGSLVAAPAMR